jgi:carbonic anhydrase/acetyltransferase-like protein (isoleucine patch superfamily)
MAVYSLAEHAPQIHESAWVADSATVLGKVTMGEQASVWYGTVVRGDNDRITIGARCNIQDASVLHSDEGVPLTLGEGVSIGHQVMLHGCTIGDGSLVGMQAIILNRAKIGKDCLVAAGAVVTEGKEFPDGSLIMGAPAKVVRQLTPEQIAHNRWIAQHYIEQMARHRLVKKIA